MPAQDFIKDKYGNAIYSNEPGYQNLLTEQNARLAAMDAKLNSVAHPQQDVPVPTRPQPNPLGDAFSSPSINPTDKVATTLLAPKEETIPRYEQDSPFEYLQKNIFTPPVNAITTGARGIGNFVSDVGQGIKETASDVGNWADQNRVGLGGFATAIGAGLARRDPSEALANYNKSIIQNKQQRQEEEKFKMATDGSHPYNQQFRELFAKMLPDVTAKLGDRFGQMTVQNFKDAGLTDLLDVTQKQIEISKNDASSPISKRTRDMASSQYGIQIPENYSANDVPRFLEAYKTENELKNKRKEIDIKQGKLELEAGKGFSDKENKENLLKIKQAEELRNQQMFKPQLQEQEVKAEIAKETKQNQIETSKENLNKLQFANNSLDPASELSKKAKNDFMKTNKKYSYLINPNMSHSDIKEIETKVIPDLIKSERTNLTSLQRQAMQSNALKAVQAIRDKNANYRAGLTNKLGYARLGETAQHNRAMEELQNKKLSDKYADTYISEGELGNQGLTKQTIGKKLEQGAGARELIRNSNTIMNKIDDVGFRDVAGLTSLSGELQSLYTNIGLDVKQNKALGAYDQGVRDLLSELAKNPTSASALAKKKMVKGQYKAVIDTINNAYKSKSIQQKWDERVGSPVDYTLKLNRAVKDADPEAIQEFSDLGYGQDDLIKAYKNSMPLKTKGGE
jgi:hypothetical protein